MFSNSTSHSTGVFPLRTSRGLLAALLLLPAAAPAQDPPQTPREEQLLRRIEELEKRLAALEARLPPAPAAPAQDEPTPSSPPQDAWRGTTVNMTIDGYYEYNFNRPADRTSVLRAYDRSSNSFSLNQAAVIVERAPDLAAGRRFGVRLDLQYGQATETLQGSPANEPRPRVYRPVFQAYGTYVIPAGKGLTVDFGKWASAFGIENNYTKDQLNYSRSYLFIYLPFYHFGFRTGYDLTKKLNLGYWLINGSGQSEDFNGFKSHVVALTLKPAGSLSWSVNYYTGVEGRQVPGQVPRRLNIADTYATWTPTSKLLFAGQADYATYGTAHLSAGAAYAAYRMGRFRLATRGEYLSDRGGLFSGATQALKETTFTADYRLAEGFLMRGEWRRDFSNRLFFPTAQPGLLKREQNTATLGMVWWVGGKQGAW